MQIILKACDCGQIADISGVRCADGELLAYQRLSPLSRHSYISRGLTQLLTTKSLAHVQLPATYILAHETTLLNTSVGNT